MIGVVLHSCGQHKHSTAPIIHLHTMKVAQRTETASTEGKPSEKLYMENTLLRVFGALFCHDPKCARTRSGKIELNRGDKEKLCAAVE